MDIQNIFYVLGIIFMVFSIGILIGIAVLLFYIKKKVSEIHTHVENIITDVTELTINPIKKTADITKSILQFVGKKRQKEE